MQCFSHLQHWQPVSCLVHLAVVFHYIQVQSQSWATWKKKEQPLSSRTLAMVASSMRHHFSIHFIWSLERSSMRLLLLPKSSISFSRILNASDMAFVSWNQVKDTVAMVLSGGDDGEAAVYRSWRTPPLPRSLLRVFLSTFLLPFFSSPLFPMNFFFGSGSSSCNILCDGFHFFLRRRVLKMEILSKKFKSFCFLFKILPVKPMVLLYWLIESVSEWFESKN